MLSRRKFLQANAATLALSLPAAGAASHGEDAAGPAPDGESKRDYWNDWPADFIARMSAVRARRKAMLDRLRTPDDVRQHADAVRAKVWELIGGRLEKTPLNPKTVGTIDRAHYRIERVIFESQPQVYVTSNLYLPKSGSPPYPGIISPLGHADNGKAYRSYQYGFQTLARKGYMVLAFDPFGQGERCQYLDGKGRSRLGPTGEHTEAGRPLLLLGASFAQYRAWDGVRALDYLLTRPEVDPHRVGCTGHSGGGTMTMYLAALEPRIQVAVEVEGNSENVAGPAYDPPGAIADAEQNLVGGLAVGLDRADLLLAFAPKPLLMCYTPQDAGSTYSPAMVEATEEIFGELQRAYGTLGVREKVGLSASPLFHDYDFFHRKAAYEWFNRWLGNPDAGTDEAPFDDGPDEALNCTSTGQVITSLGGRSVLDLNRDRARDVVPVGRFRSANADITAERDRLRRALTRVLALPENRTPLGAQVLSRSERQGLVLEEFQFQSEPGLRVPGWFIKPASQTGRLPAVLYVSEGNLHELVDEPGRLDAIPRAGHSLCAIELRGLGSTRPRFPSAGPNFYGSRFAESYDWANLVLGTPTLGGRVWDVLRALDYLETRQDVERSRIRVLGAGNAGLAALAAAALDDRPQSLLLDRTLASYRSVVESEDYSLPLGWFALGLLREFDAADLAASICPRPCWIVNATDARGHTLAESEARERYGERVDLQAAAFRTLRFVVAPEAERPQTYLQWLESGS